MMKPEELRVRLGGVVSFPVTPFRRGDLALDREGLATNLEALSPHPMSVVVAAGGTGEVYSLDVAEHEAVVAATVARFGGKTPVVAGVGGSLPIALEQARRAAAAGVDGILALPPYYPGAPDDGLLAYYQAIGAATPLGLFVYSRDWVNPGPEFVARLAAATPTLIAWKDGQADLRRYQMIMNRVGDRLHYVGGAGDDMVPGYYSIGIRTYTSSIATVAPKLSLELHRLGAAGDSAGLNRLMRELVVPLYDLRSRKKGYEVTIMKAAMDAVGLVGGAVRPPLPELRPEDVADVKAMMATAKWKAWL
jgi:5-dehydro-4-deoxyglucarate dehydratase